MEITNNPLFSVILLSVSIFVITKLVKKYRFSENEKRRQALTLQKLETTKQAGPKSDIEQKLTLFYQKRFFTTGAHIEELRNLVIQFNDLDVRDIRMRRAFVRAVLNSTPENLAETIISSLTKDDGQEIRNFLIAIITINIEDEQSIGSFINEFNKKEKLLPSGSQKKAAKETLNYILSITN